MNAALEDDWLRANQEALMQEVALVRAALQRHAGRDAPASQGPAGDHVVTMLDVVCERFGLSSFERKIVVLAAAVELDGRFAALCGLAQDDASRAYPTFGLALAALEGAHWSALSPAGPLRRWRLVEAGPGPLTSAPLRIDEWLLHVLTGTGALDVRLEPIVRWLGEARLVVESQQLAVEEIVDSWSSDSARKWYPLVQLWGGDPEGKRAVASAVAERLDWRSYVVEVALLPSTAEEIELFVRLWEREAMLRAAVLVIDAHDHQPDGRGNVARVVERLAAPTIALTQHAPRIARRVTLPVRVDKPTRLEQSRIWRLELGDRADALGPALDRVLAQFDLDASTISVAAHVAPHDDGRLADAIWEACRSQTRAELDDLAQSITPRAAFEDHVLPHRQLATLHDMVAHVRNRARVYDEWQMGGPTQLGLGLTALFSGQSGTGKTLAAEVIAHELQLDLYRVDLSQVVSKYIGETEKNLRRIFDAAESVSGVLLFDEADALFGKRSEVRDSHDRYANVEISYLLQRMEAYRGLAILTTNMRSAIDAAFMRRLRFVVTFPFPDETLREQIWRRAFGARAPLQRIAFDRLAQLNVAGGNIRNIALYAAFAAAERDEPISMNHLLRGVEVEFAKLDRAPTDRELVGWA